MVPITRRSTYIELSAPVDPTTTPTATVVFMEGAGTRTDFNVTVMPERRINFNLNIGAPNLLPSTVYTITISGLRDAFGQPIPGSFSNTFTTAP